MSPSVRHNGAYFGIKENVLTSLATANADTFRPYLGTTFRVDADGAAILVTLTDVRASQPGNGPRREPFSLIFSGPATPLLPQRTYDMTHEKLEPMAIFLVPVAADAQCVQYEAVFN